MSLITSPFYDLVVGLHAVVFAMTLPEWGAIGASVISITSLHLYGNKTVWAPILGASAIVPWMMVALCGPVILWGLVPANVLFALIHLRNLRKWIKERV